MGPKARDSVKYDEVLNRWVDGRKKLTGKQNAGN